ncbi:PmoA family protein [Microbacterium chocolatum]|uniref:DUF6807 domain-containing protein n=1 Tax=Microbacterium aurantiacum TaxID=162393 RepID=UPI00338DDA40
MAAFTLDLTDAAASVTASGIEVARYVFDPALEAEGGEKPYLHPLRSLDGATVSAYRPWDHRWHKGLQVTWTHVSGENFWGGPTYVDGLGYVPQDNVGTIHHDAFTATADAGDEVSLDETLTWITRAGDAWIAERRRHRFHGLDHARGLWALDLATSLRNISGRPLELGSPTTQGRPDAGYTGVALRLARAWTGGRVLSSAEPEADAADPAAVMGSTAEWIALSGEHDEVDGGGTVLAFAGSSTGDPAMRWFVRSEPFPILAPSPAFSEPITLDPDAELALTHRWVIGDRIWSPAETRAVAHEYAL